MRRGFTAIHGVVVGDGARAVLVMKDETRYPEPRKRLRIATADAMAGPYRSASPAFSPGWVEGPTVPDVTFPEGMCHGTAFVAARAVADALER